jgi:hypothetical protein
MRKPFPTNSASAYLGRLNIAELKKYRKDTNRGWVWRGAEREATEKDTPEVLVEVLTVQRRLASMACGGPAGSAAGERKQVAFAARASSSATDEDDR